MTKKKSSPFSYGKTVSQVAFTNRTKELAHLKRNFRQGINTIIVSPRRWGKSSLIEKVVEELKGEQKLKISRLDLFTVASEHQFYELFAREVIKSASTKWEDWLESVKSAFRSIVPKVSFGLDPQNDFELSFEWDEKKVQTDEILNLPETLARKHNVKMVVCIDEFQHLSEFKGYEALEKRLRSIWQRHKNVCYCLYGSKRHMMTEIFSRSSKPFYKFGDLMMLQKIELKHWIPFIVNGFKKSGKAIAPELAAVIPMTMNNHPWYVQQMSFYTLNYTTKKAGIEHLRMALEQIIQSNTPLYEKEIDVLSETQVSLLRAVASGETQLTSSSVMRKYKLGTPNNVTRNKRVLFNTDLLDEVGGVYEFLDPVFFLWFRQRFYGIEPEISKSPTNSK